MPSFVFRDGKIVPKETATPISRGPAVISDYLPTGALVHPSTGKMMDSKSQFRAVTKALGKQEIGNEVQRDTRRVEMPNLKRDIAQAIERLGG